MSVWILQCKYEISDASHAAYTKSLKLAADSRSGRHGNRRPRNSDQGADVMWVFLKICDSHSKRQYQAAPLRDQRRKTIPFLASALATQSASSQMTPVSGNAKLLALKQTRRLTDFGKPGSPNRRQIVVHIRRMFFPLNLSERHNHA